MAPRSRITDSSIWKTRADFLSENLLHRPQPPNASQVASLWKMKKARIGKAPALRDRKLLKLGPDCELGQVERRRRYVRFGSKADMCAAKRHVCFTPNSDRGSGLPQTAMSALPPIADMCSAIRHVCFGPKADISSIQLFRRHGRSRKAGPIYPAP